MSPRRVLAEHSSRDLSDWQAFEVAFGFHDALADDYRAGVIASAGMKVDDRPARPSDFFPRLSDPDDADEPVAHDDAEPDLEDVEVDEVERQSEALRSVFAAWGLRHNAAIRRAREQGLNPDDPQAN